MEPTASGGGSCLALAASYQSEAMHYQHMDYFHLAKYDGKWMIVNVLWQSLPPRKEVTGKE